MTNKEFAQHLGIEYYCPENDSKVHFSLEYLSGHITADLPSVLLGIGGGYLDVECIIEFVSDNVIGLYDFESSTLKLQDIMPLLKEKISCIDLETWALSFEKLFYVASCWLNENTDFNTVGSEGVFQVLWNDFFFVPADCQIIFFPPSASRYEERFTPRFRKYVAEWIVDTGHEFLEKEKAKIEREDFHRSEWFEDFESILEGWKMRYYEGEIPQLVKDYEESHKKL